MRRTCTMFFVPAVFMAGVLTLAILCIAPVQLFAQTLTTNSPNLPPPPGTYISPQLFHQLYAAGIVIKDISHSKFTQSQPPPPPGGSQVHNFGSQVDGMVSMDGGMTFNPFVAQANVAVLVQSTQDIGSTRFFNTEMLQLNIQGGSLPGGVMIRESPSLQSTGKTQVTFEPAQVKINSFFDIFTELSVNGGMSWMPGQNGATHMALQGDPPIPIVTSSANLPPNPSHYVSPDEWHQLYANGIIVKDVSHERFTQNQPPPQNPGQSQNHSFGSTVRMQVSTNGGMSFTPLSAPASVLVQVTKPSTEPPGTSGTYQTEMLALDISGGGLPAGTAIRESPTLASTGQTKITPAPGGLYKIDSFFDIFTEMTTDGGMTWSPTTTGPAHMQVEPDPPPIVTSSPNLPPIPSHYVSPEEWHQQYANGIVIKDVSHEGFTHNDPPPPPGGSQSHQFESIVKMQVSTNGGMTFQPVEGTASVDVMVRSTSDNGDTRYFETEMLQLNLTGLPGGAMVRESPSKQSLGKTSVRFLPGQYMIGSFFDIFTDISLDGGMTWTEASGPVQMELQTQPVPDMVTICGVKYEDINGNGIQDAGEPVLGGWPVKATDGGGNVVASAITEPMGGTYCLTLPAPGTYKVEELLQSGWMQTGGKPYYTLTTAVGQNINGIDFGNFKYGSIFGTKFNDLDGDGQRDANEPGLPGWTICIQRFQPPPSPVFPTTGGTDFLGTTMATVNINLYPAYSGLNVTMCASGNTTVQRANPSGPTPNDSMQTEITTLEMTGFLPPTLPNDKFIIRHVKDRRSYGSIQGNNFPAISDFDVYFEVVMPASLGGGTYVNYTATNMSAGPGITTIPPGGQNYLGFNTYLVNKNNPLDTLGLIKTVNHCVLGGAQPGTQRCDCPSKAPPNLPPPGAPVGTSCVTTDANGNYYFNDLPPGNYEVTEVQQAGWTQTSGAGTVYPVMSGSQFPVLIGNKVSDVHLCIHKYLDANHNNQRDPAEGPALGNFCFGIFPSNFPAGSLCTDPMDGSICVDLPPGEYDIVENVPAGWTSTDPKGGVKHVVLVVGQDQTIDWGNAPALTDSTFRTATMEEWAKARDPKGKLKAVKCKPIAVDFKVNLRIPNNPVIPIKVHFKFSVPVDKIFVSPNKDKSYYLTCAVGTPKDPLKPVEWTVDLTNCGLPPGTLLQFTCHGTKGALPKVHYDWLSLAGTILVKGDLAPLRKGGVVGDTLKNVYLRLPMPNLVNVGEDLQAKQGYFPFTTGAATGSSSVIYLKYNDVQKSLVKAGKTPQEDILHTHLERPLDYFDSKDGIPVTTKPILKQQKSLPPVKHNNRLYAEALALQLNIMASQGAQFPVGFGDLIWDDHKNTVCGTDLFNGKPVKEIMQQINQFLVFGGANPKPGLQAYNYWCVAKYLNLAFAGCALDTVSWGCVKVKMTGCIRLKDVPYLRAPLPGSVPEFTEPVGVNSQYTPDHYALNQNYPNPFNPTTTISFELPTTSLVTLEIFNTLGQKVGTLIDREELEDGVQDVEFDATALSSGIYFYKLTATSMTEDESGNLSAGETHVILKKMMLIK